MGSTIGILSDVLRLFSAPRQHVQDEASARSIPCACIGVYLTTEQCHGAQVSICVCGHASRGDGQSLTGLGESHFQCYQRHRQL